MAERCYYGMVRLSGEPLLEHLLRSARYYAELRIDFNGIIATLLHHRLPAEEYENNEIFNDDVSGLLNTLETVFAYAKKERVEAKTVFKYILSFKDDLRVTLIKLSETFDKARTIDLLFPVEKRMNVARRLLEIYAPLAEYMNLTKSSR